MEPNYTPAAHILPVVKTGLDDNKCPKCDQIIDDEKVAYNSTTHVAMESDDHETVYDRMFGSTINKLLQHHKVEVPDNANDLEDALLVILPLTCRFYFGHGTPSNLTQDIKF